MRLGVLQHLAADTVHSLRRVGLPVTVQIIASSLRDVAFDRTYGTDTAGYADPRVYASDDPRARRATFYVPTRARPFRDFLAWSGVPPTGTFVDFGCGKGRALFVAAQHGFRRAVGVELSPRFCRAAEHNLARLQAHVAATQFRVICDDAGNYAVAPDDRVFYFYDPFDDALIERCLQRIAASLAAVPRPVYVIYHNNIAVRPTPFDAQVWLRETPTPRFAGNAFYLYRHDPAAAPRAEAPCS
ncbi:MAG: class I SAM-dependent methyltransferase [Deltaproteobacteria bacterium]|nr:class I SAM-dependent methyltransferase [Deltaproteobacteria bacterium]